MPWSMMSAVARTAGPFALLEVLALLAGPVADGTPATEPVVVGTSETGPPASTHCGPKQGGGPPKDSVFPQATTKAGKSTKELRNPAENIRERAMIDAFPEPPGKGAPSYATYHSPELGSRVVSRGAPRRPGRNAARRRSRSATVPARSPGRASPSEGSRLALGKPRRARQAHTGEPLLETEDARPKVCILHTLTGDLDPRQSFPQLFGRGGLFDRGPRASSRWGSWGRGTILADQRRANFPSAKRTPAILSRPRSCEEQRRFPKRACRPP